MEGKFQHQVAFYLTGSREGSDLEALSESCRPALFARHLDLSSLRYDFPIVLNQEGAGERAIVSLSGLVDEAVAKLADDPECGRLARHGYRIEREIRHTLTANGPADFGEIWKAAFKRLAAEDISIVETAKHLWTSFHADGDIIDVGTELPDRAVRHLWSGVQAKKAATFRQKADRLLLKLRAILDAEVGDSPTGRAPERLKASVGASFADTFDFDAMSRILVESKPAIALSNTRRARVRHLIEVLEQQRFYPLGDDGPAPFNFDFAKCSDALRAYNERHAGAVELVKAIAVADLEANGEYREAVHNVLFESFGANGLDAGELAQLPDYLICTHANTLDPAETAQIVELLAAGLPFKILVRTDDILEPSPIAEGHIALGLRSRQLVNTAISLTDVFVFQASASQLVRKQASLVKGLNYDGPALISVFSGVNGHTGDLPAYMVAAAATESRAFPSLVYDPSAGTDWAMRLSVEDNPSPDDDWPVHTFAYEDKKLGSNSEELAFTIADFMVTDERFREHYAAIASDGLQSDATVTVPDALETDFGGIRDKLPSITIVDDTGQLQRAIIDDRMLDEVRRCRAMWHSLQELGGIHNSHAERLLARERETRVDAVPAPPAIEQQQTASLESAAPASTPVVEMAAAEPEPAESHGDEPYIDTARCTTCNECTQINSRMFSYNENKQAFIADPDAGTYRQLVEAAEGCQVSIIHPGKPRNPKEPGLEDLIRRAAEFV